MNKEDKLITKVSFLVPTKFERYQQFHKSWYQELTQPYNSNKKPLSDYIKHFIEQQIKWFTDEIGEEKYSNEDLEKVKIEITFYKDNMY